MSTRGRNTGGFQPARSSGNRAKAQPAQPPQPDPAELCALVAPALEAYGFSEADVQKLVKRCNYDMDKIQEAVAHVFEDREGHEHGDWATTATSADKKEKQAEAKERKAQREKEAAEEAEREKQRRLKAQEEEKKRHLELAARRQQMELEKKNKPGSALIQRSAPWRPGGAQNIDAAVEAPVEALVPEEPPLAETKEEYVEQPADDAAAESAETWGQSYEAADASHNDGYSAHQEASASDWNGHWQDNGGWTDAGSAEQPVVNGKDQSSAESADPSVPGVVPQIENDTVSLPKSFWDLFAGRSIPQVMFGSLHPAAEAGEIHDDDGLDGDGQDGRASRRDRPQNNDRKNGGKKGGGGRRGKGGEADAKKGDATQESTADDGKGRPRKGAARGASAEKGGPGSGAGKGNKGYRNDREKGDRQKGASKA